MPFCNTCARYTFCIEFSISEMQNMQALWFLELWNRLLCRAKHSVVQFLLDGSEHCNFRAVNLPLNYSNMQQTLPAFKLIWVFFLMPTVYTWIKHYCWPFGKANWTQYWIFIEYFPSWHFKSTLLLACWWLNSLRIEGGWESGMQKWWL